jgi:hypothetical protein
MMKIEQAQRMQKTMWAIGSGFQSVLFADVRTIVDATALCPRSARRGRARTDRTVSGCGATSAPCARAVRPAFVRLWTTSL